MLSPPPQSDEPTIKTRLNWDLQAKVLDYLPRGILRDEQRVCKEWFGSRSQLKEYDSNRSENEFALCNSCRRLLRIYGDFVEFRSVLPAPYNFWCKVCMRNRPTAQPQSNATFTMKRR